MTHESPEGRNLVPPPINPRDISPVALARFFQDQKPSLNCPDPIRGYWQIFTLLRPLPPDEQERLLVGFFTKGVKEFLKGEPLGKYLAEINNIPFLKPGKEPSPESLQDLVNQHRSRLNLLSLPVRIIKNNWRAALGTAKGVGRHITDDEGWNVTAGVPFVVSASRYRVREIVGAVVEKTEAGRMALWSKTESAVNTARLLGASLKAAREIAWDAAENAVVNVGLTPGLRSISPKVIPAAGDAAWDGSWGAVWLIVKDLMSQNGYIKGNPSVPLMEIWNQGCWPIGEDKDKDEFVIFVPPVQKDA